MRNFTNIQIVNEIYLKFNFQDISLKFISWKQSFDIVLGS